MCEDFILALSSIYGFIPLQFENMLCVILILVFVEICFVAENMVGFSKCSRWTWSVYSLVLMYLLINLVQLVLHFVCLSYQLEWG